MQGYLNRPEETAKIMAGDWLRTGDFGWCDDDGYLFVKDRLKEVFKCNGNQIAPAELEAVLLKHPHIADALQSDSVKDHLRCTNGRPPQS